MISFLIIHFLVVITCSECDSARTNCGSFKMKKEMPNRQTFDQKLRKVYNRVNSTSLECAGICYGDEQCNGMLVCPGVCHLFGVFSVHRSTTPGADFNNCDVFNILIFLIHFVLFVFQNRCKKNGFPDDSGYCSCTRGYGGPFCETVVKDSCYNQWHVIYDSETAQSLDPFERAASKPHGLKIKYITEGKKIRGASSLYIRNSTIVVQSPFGLSKSSWNSFNVTPKRLFELTTNGRMHSVLSVNIVGTPALTSTSASTINATWLIKDFTDGESMP
ncbi:uncharacterized protein LOC121388382 [Gigantopelta aegis]|uniref:uncharacterized protein LOC121388382 n=1 Tax=Gigantopelta aegis TaxID=1735272 RepID=UPI001B889E6F|nr:uncharacterized protein LOC121388382 [Gigantopelta aegis]